MWPMSLRFLELESAGTLRKSTMVTIQTDPLAAQTRRNFQWLDQSIVHQASEYSATFLTEFLVMAAQLIAYKLAAHQLGTSGFAEYALARRTISLLFPVPVLGLSVGLPRYIGFANGRGDREGAARYYGATLWCVGGAALCCFVAMNFFARTFAYLLFGNVRYSYLAFPLSLIVVALCIHTVVCGYFRGHMDMNRANLLQFVNFALVPILSFLVVGSSLSRTLTSIGVVSTLVSVVGLLKTPFRAIALNNLKEAGELVRYGIQRVPGDFVLMALFTLPATFVAHLRGVQEAGFVAFGISVVSMIGSVFAPVGLVLLPKATTMLARGAREDLRQHLQLILQVTLALCFVIILVIEIWIPRLILLYLGPGFEQIVPVVRVLALGALPYSLYVVLRNLVDAHHEYGVTAAILTGGLAVFLTVSFSVNRLSGNPSLTLFLSAFLLALCTIATLSGWECRRILRS
jgi:O-antigen/teichoic acid export membrane protein